MAEAPRVSWLGTLGWACYLACSWTWCIGMFLPVLLIRDYGVWGFVVFAVPNVVGAAAMGWVLQTPRSSVALVSRNRRMVRSFTLVTCVFHVVFVSWLLRHAGGAMLLSVAIVLGAFVAYEAWWVRGSTRRLLAGSAITWCVSAALIGALCMTSAPTTTVGSADGSAGLLFLAPVCVFGFALCPYLDGTFHRARISLGRASVAGFAAGFGILFLAMILGTVAYAPMFRADEDPMRLVAPDSIGAGLLMAHIALQSAFTIRVHGATLPPQFHTPSASARWGFAGGLMIAALHVLAGVTQSVEYHGLAISEVIYRIFMSFYGLVFPAYVWLCMIPTRDGHSGIEGPIGRRKLVVWAVAVVLAAPAYWMGFIERVEWWLTPGLAVVLAARLVLPGGAGFGRLQTETAGPRGSAATEA